MSIALVSRLLLGSLLIGCSGCHLVLPYEPNRNERSGDVRPMGDLRALDRVAPELSMVDVAGPADAPRPVDVSGQKEGHQDSSRDRAQAADRSTCYSTSLLPFPTGAWFVPGGWPGNGTWASEFAGGTPTNYYTIGGTPATDYVVEVEVKRPVAVGLPDNWSAGAGIGVRVHGTANPPAQFQCLAADYGSLLLAQCQEGASCGGVCCMRAASTISNLSWPVRLTATVKNNTLTCSAPGAKSLSWSVGADQGRPALVTVYATAEFAHLSVCPPTSP